MVMLIAAVSVITLAWYVCVERPAITARAALQALEGALAVGDHVTTADGFAGRVVAIDGACALVRTEPGDVVMVVSMASILERRAASSVDDAARGQGVVAGATMALLGREFAGASNRWFSGPSSGQFAAGA